MDAIELKVPPVVVTLLSAVAMWGISTVTPPAGLPEPWRSSVAIVIALLAASVAIPAIAGFFRARTTVDPRDPGKASGLVTGGVYRLTRNPMYLAMVLLLVEGAVLLDSGWALAWLPVHIAYMTRFQIIPEERALAALFGTEYEAFRSRVRRWV